MAFFPFFKNKKVLCRCTHCSYEYTLSLRQIKKIKKHQKNIWPYDESLCFFQEFCVHCCKGLIIPVNFTDKHGNNYSFHKLKHKLSLPDDETILKRIIQFRNDIGDPIFFI